MTIPSGNASSLSPLAPISCCADLYQHPLVLAMMGQSWHPGGLSLTQALAKGIKLSKGDHVLDVACGRAASVLMLGRTYGCRVTGIDTSTVAIREARKEAHRCRLEKLVTFTQADATRLPFVASTFSAALCECATSLFADKRAAFSEVARVLKPGGYLALSDVTFRPETLPQPLESALAWALCIPLGVGPEAYAQLIRGAGFVVECQTDHSGALAQLFDQVELLLQVGHLATLGPLFTSPSRGKEKLCCPLKGEDWDGSEIVSAALVGRHGDLLRQVEVALHCSRQLLQQGDLSYWAFIARKA